MKRIPDTFSNRWGYHGWAVSVDDHILQWTFSTTRDEARDLLYGIRIAGPELFRTRYRVVKVKFSLKEAFE